MAFRGNGKTMVQIYYLNHLIKCTDQIQFWEMTMPQD